MEYSYTFNGTFTYILQNFYLYFIKYIPMYIHFVKYPFTFYNICEYFIEYIYIL